MSDQNKLEELRTRYERHSFTSCDDEEGNLKSKYAGWLESEVLRLQQANGESKEHIPALHLRGVSRCFFSESELRLHIETSIPIAIKPTRKSKTTFVYPFTSYKAKEAVVECIVEGLLNNG